MHPRCLRFLMMMVVILPLTGCLFRSRKVESRMSTAQLKQATEAELVSRINSEASKIQTLNASVEISTSVGGWTKGKITQYQKISGYILVRKPGMLRMIGLLPIVRNRAFDMVSNGLSFELYIPPKNRFVVGRNDIISHNTNQPLENLRPQHILDALLVREIDPSHELVVLENGYETVSDPNTKKEAQQPNYILIVIDRGDSGWYLSRKIIFSRTDLVPHQQIIYDKNGYIASDVHYTDFNNRDGIDFPFSIDIWRPQEEYDINLSVARFTVNQPLSDEQFALQQPPGAQVVRLDVPNASRSAGGDGEPPSSNKSSR
jgi:outer membrane lipoprotein-sorting protein